LAYCAEHHRENAERISKYQKEYYERNKEALADQQKEYYQRYKEEIKKKRERYFAQILASRMWMSRHYHNDEIFRLAHLIRDRTGKAIRDWLKTGNVRQCVKYKRGEIGYIDFPAIIAHLGEPPGEIGIGRDKYTLDHIIPLRWLRLHDDPIEYAIGAHYLNCRYLLFGENYNRQFDGLSEDECRLYEEIRANVISSLSS